MTGAAVEMAVYVLTRSREGGEGEGARFGRVRGQPLLLLLQRSSPREEEATHQIQRSDKSRQQDRNKDHPEPPVSRWVGAPFLMVQLSRRGGWLGALLIRSLRLKQLPIGRPFGVYAEFSDRPFGVQR